MHANKREEIQEIFAGRHLRRGGTEDGFDRRHDLRRQDRRSFWNRSTSRRRSFSSRSSRRPRPTRKSWAWRSRSWCRKIRRFRVNTDPRPARRFFPGMGELHLEIIVDRMMREFGVGANVGKPQVAYRETIRKPAAGGGRFVRQTGGRGQYGAREDPGGAAAGGHRVRVRERDYAAARFRRNSSGRSKPASRKRSRAACSPAIPMSDVKVTLYDGSYHDVDSSEMAFKIAGSMAIKEAAKKAKPVLLEPIMAVEVVVPEEYMGDVIGDLNSRRGPHRRHGAARDHADHQVDGAAVGNVRLRDRAALAHAGPRQLHDALREVRRSARLAGRGNRQPGAGKE